MKISLKKLEMPNTEIAKDLEINSSKPQTNLETKGNLSFTVGKNSTPKSPQSKKTKRIIYISSIVVLILVLVISGFVFGKIYIDSKNNSSNQNGEQFSSNSQQLLNTPTPTPAPVFYPNPINGVMIDEATYDSLKTKPFLAVMIQNNTASRPEYGLNEADIVYESIVEGNITRFMAVYWSKSAERVQSLRSARRYFVDILGDYNNPAYMHIGYAYCVPTEVCDTRNDALVEMNKYGVRRLSDAYDSVTKQLSFSRDAACEKIKATEHCAYTSTDRLWAIAAQKGWKNDLTNYVSWNFVDSPSLAEVKDLTDFTTYFKSYGNSYDGNYAVTWRFDPITKKYLRFNLDKTPYLDGNKAQITTDTIIYQKVVSTPSLDHKGHQYQETIGSGTGYVMQQGKVFPINWSKKSFADKTIYTDPTTGKNFDFQRGKIWTMIVPKYYDYTNNTPIATPTATVSVTPTK